MREIDALGGLMGIVADATTIQFRRLNTRRGLAVQASRAQVDIDRYPRILQAELAKLTNLDVIEDEVVDILLASGRVMGVTGSTGELHAPSVIVTTGTFLSAIMHCGEQQTAGGRVGDGSSHALARTLKALGLRVGRLKTGTVPRIDGRTVEWSRTRVQSDTVRGARFSFRQTGYEPLRRVDCHITHTNERVHDIIRRDMHLSPMRTGAIRGRGPRYCPSIEDKVARYPDRDQHLLFLEPEGLDTHRIYVNGISTSLPTGTQYEFVREIDGLRNATILQYGYAVEYDFADPTALDHGLQHREIPGLYFAGQVNGTSGYEEAAAQGLVAGVSAARGKPMQLLRSQAYIGVLVDDLVTKGIGGEPYRMFTSRAEHRLMLREDNADRRLLPLAHQLGLIDGHTWSNFERKSSAIQGIRETLEDALVNPKASTLEYLREHGLGTLRSPITAATLLRRPEASLDVVWPLICSEPLPDRDAALQVEIDIKYEGYIARAERRATAATELERVKIPVGTDWRAMNGLSTEVRERLASANPTTLGQAARLPGVTPAAVNALTAWLAKGRAASGGST